MQLDGRVENIELGHSTALIEGWASASDGARLVVMRYIGSKKAVKVDILNSTRFPRFDLDETFGHGIAAAFSIAVPLESENTEFVVICRSGDYQIELAALAKAKSLRPRGDIEAIGLGGVAGFVFDLEAQTSRHAMLQIDHTIDCPIQLISRRSNMYFPIPVMAFQVTVTELHMAAHYVDKNFNLFDGLAHTIELIYFDEYLCRKEFLYESDVESFLEVKGRTLEGFVHRRSCPSLSESVDIIIDNAFYANTPATITRLYNGMPQVGGFCFKLPLYFTSSFLLGKKTLNPAMEGKVKVASSQESFSNGAFMIDEQNTPRRGRTLFSSLPMIPPEITILIPVFNARNELETCLDSIFKYTKMPCKLIIIDDASTDKSLNSLYEAISIHHDVVVIKNIENRGFSGSINVGLKISVGDVVLLNSDTVVSDGWLQGLMIAAYSSPKIATATAISDNAGFFSVPEPEKSNDFSHITSLEQIALLVKQVSSVEFPYVPTGNGFCMYIRRESLDLVGGFDEEGFPSGYGEENDFCWRARRKGYTHVIDDRTFVLHKRMTSFGPRSVSLKYEASVKLSERYPEYPIVIKAAGSTDAMLKMRWNIRRGLQMVESKRLRRRILFLISTNTGGTPQTNRDLMIAIQPEFETFCLRSDGSVLYLTTIVDGKETKVSTVDLQNEMDIATHTSIEYDACVMQILVDFGIDLVHVRHLAWHSFGLAEVCRRLCIPLVMSFHDFYMSCPSLKLLDGENRYCRGRCTTNQTRCRAELWPNDRVPELKNKFVHRWREMTNIFISKVDALVTTSQYAKTIIEENISISKEKPFTIISHGRSFKDFGSIELFSKDTDKKIRIIIPGNISTAKGAELIKEIVFLDCSNEMEFHVLGNPGRLAALPQLKHHGSYCREDFGDLIHQIKPHLGLVLSVWPETYSHTLTELWACGIPVVGLDIGAVGERLHKFEAGWLFGPNQSAKDLYSGLIRIKNDSNGMKNKLDNVAKWQSGEGRNYGVREMALQYLELYGAVFEMRKRFPGKLIQADKAV